MIFRLAHQPTAPAAAGEYRAPEAGIFLENVGNPAYISPLIAADLPDRPRLCRVYQGCYQLPTVHTLQKLKLMVGEMCNGINGQNQKENSRSESMLETLKRRIGPRANY